MKKYSFYLKFSYEVEADNEKEACLAAAQIFEKETRPWRDKRGAPWKKQLQSGDFDETKNVTAYV